MSATESAISGAMPKSLQRILSGPLKLEVLRFGVPLAIGMGLQTTFNLVDAYIIARLEGATANAALAAIASCDNVAAVGTILSYGISIATGAIISRRHGAGDTAGVQKAAWQSLLLMGLISSFFGVLGLVGSEFLLVDVMQAKGEVAAVGVPYLQVTMAGSGGIFMLLHLITLQRALGSSKTPIVILVVANAANLLLAVLLVYGPGDAPVIFSWAPPVAELLGLPRLELLGAAWATVIARLLALLPAFIVAYARHGLFRKGARGRPELATMKRIWDVAWPTSSQLVVRIVAILAVIALTQNAFTTESDQSTATALGVVLRWETMALFVGLGWGSASQTFVGQNLGANNRERARLSGWYMTFYNALMMGVLAIACLLWGDSMLGFFSRDPHVIALGQDYLNWVAPSYVGLGIGIVLGSAIQGAGATRMTFLLDLKVILAFQIPLCWLATRVADAPTLLWQAVAITYAASAVVYIFAYRRGTFLQTQLA